MNNNFQCCVCGKRVKYCNSCVVVKNPIYEAGYCSENCKSIWDILSKHGTAQASDKATIKALKKVEFPESFTDGVQEHIDMLFGAVEESQPDIEVEIFEEKEETQEVE